GKDDEYYNGKLLQSVTFSGDRELSSTVTTYEDCPVAEVEGDLREDVRYICETATATLTKEGLDADRHVKTEMTMEYDGYGNVVRSVDLGVTEFGGGACEPCDGRDPEVFGRAC